MQKRVKATQHCCTLQGIIIIHREMLEIMDMKISFGFIHCKDSYILLLQNGEHKLYGPCDFRWKVMIQAVILTDHKENSSVFTISLPKPNEL